MIFKHILEITFLNEPELFYLFIFIHLFIFIFIFLFIFYFLFFQS